MIENAIGGVTWFINTNVGMWNAMWNPEAHVVADNALLAYGASFLLYGAVFVVEILALTFAYFFIMHLAKRAYIVIAFVLTIPVSLIVGIYVGILKGRFGKENTFVERVFKIWTDHVSYVAMSITLEDERNVDRRANGGTSIVEGIMRSPIARDMAFLEAFKTQQQASRHFQREAMKPGYNDRPRFEDGSLKHDQRQDVVGLPLDY